MENRLTTLVAEYINNNDVLFVERCKTNEYMNDYVILNGTLTNHGMTFQDAIFTNDIPSHEMGVFMVSEIVGLEQEIYKSLEKLSID